MQNEQQHSNEPSLTRAAGLVDIFDFTSHVNFLVAVERSRCLGGRRMTLDRWATSLGFRSPRSIAMILKGQRLPSLKMTAAIAKDLKLSRNEGRYLELLVEKARGERAGSPVDGISAELAKLNPQENQRHLIDVKAFAYISDWYHVVIKQLVAAPDFVEDPAWIFRRLRKKVSPAKIRDSLATLLSLGLVNRSTLDGRLHVSKESLHTLADVPSAAVRNHHRDMIDRAREALEEQNMSDREFATATFRMPLQKMPDIKQRLRHFLDDLEKDFGDAGSTDVFQCNVQLFEHTGKVREAIN